MPNPRRQNLKRAGLDVTILAPSSKPVGEWRGALPFSNQGKDEPMPDKEQYGWDEGYRANPEADLATRVAALEKELTDQYTSGLGSNQPPIYQLIATWSALTSDAMNALERLQKKVWDLEFRIKRLENFAMRPVRRETGGVFSAEPLTAHEEKVIRAFKGREENGGGDC